MRKLLILAGAAILVVFVAMKLRGGKRADPESEIRAALAAATAAAEAQDLKGVMAVVSRDFASTLGDRQTLNGFLFVELRRGAWQKVFLVGTRVAVDPGEPPTTAKVKTGVVLAGANAQKPEDVLPGRGGIYQFDLDFVREDDAWRVIGATYRESDLAGLLGL